MDPSLYPDVSPVCEECQVDKPTEPLQRYCCGTGCTPCVFDLYDEDLQNWKRHCYENHQGRHSVVAINNSPVLTPSSFTTFELIKITAVSGDTNLYRFKIPNGGSLHLSVGQHVVLRGTYEGRSITRQYTPVSSLHSKGYFDVFIKIYADGPMSQYIKQWEVGQVMEWCGPYGNFKYSHNQYSHLVLLAAGTGLAPMLQVMQHVVSNDEDDTVIQLIYACRNYQDLLMKPLLDELSSYWNINILYVIRKKRRSNWQV
ncbi:NADH-cytochrome b5 reductase-like isoform X2 [Antedon mediterranea]|uniref:NADH-cytochrome b5 reductase-like isoform X2 n=1 Tax=Antedon mediterranea TaxID=105859 RepID=UPI003AF681E8